MEVLRSTFRRQSAHSTSSTGRQQKKALLIGIKYDTPGSPDSDTFGKLGGPHDDVFAVQRLLIGRDLLPSHPRGLPNAHCHSVQTYTAIWKRTS